VATSTDQIDARVRIAYAREVQVRDDIDHGIDDGRPPPVERRDDRVAAVRVGRVEPLPQDPPALAKGAIDLVQRDARGGSAGRKLREARKLGSGRRAYWIAACRDERSECDQPRNGCDLIHDPSLR